MNSFKPCPFCGGNIEIVSDDNIYDGRKWCEMEYAECQKCYMRSPSMEVDEDNEKHFLELWNSRPTMDNSHIEAILANGKRCLEIFYGERPDEECLQCPYRDKCVDCVFSLIEEQDKILRLLKNKYAEGEQDVQT